MFTQFYNLLGEKKHSFQKRTAEILTPVVRGMAHSSVLSLSMKDNNFILISLAICDFNTIALRISSES